MIRIKLRKIRDIYQNTPNRLSNNKFLTNIQSSLQLHNSDITYSQHKKNLITLTNYFHFLIQSTQTNINQTLLAAYLGFYQDNYNAQKKYKSQIIDLFNKVLMNYETISLNEFKNITCSFIDDFEEFIQIFLQESQCFEVINGNIKVKIKEGTQRGNRQVSDDKRDMIDEVQQQVVIRHQQQLRKQKSQISLRYFKSLKQNIKKLNQSQLQIIQPLCQDNYLPYVLSEDFIVRLVKITSLYIQISMQTQRMQDQDQNLIPSLNALIIQIIKINKAFKKSNKSSSHVSKVLQIINNFLQQIYQIKDTIKIFSQNILKMILDQIKSTKLVSNKMIQQINQENQTENKIKVKVNKLKQKLNIKKSKKLQKFKLNHSKYQERYNKQINQLQQQQKLTFKQKLKQNAQLLQLQPKLTCIICSQNDHKDNILSSNLCISTYIQLTNLYSLFIKQKLSTQKDQQKFDINFKTCGHYIHKSCIKKNVKQYKNCQYCKSSINFLFPIKFLYFKQIKNKLNGQKLPFQEMIQLQKVQSNIYDQIIQTYNELYNFFTSEVQKQQAYNRTIIQKHSQHKNQIPLKLYHFLTTQIILKTTFYSQLFHPESLHHSILQQKQLLLNKLLLQTLKIYQNQNYKKQINQQKLFQQKQKNLIKNKTKKSKKIKKIFHLNQKNQKFFYNKNNIFLQQQKYQKNNNKKQNIKIDIDFQKEQQQVNSIKQELLLGQISYSQRFYQQLKAIIKIMSKQNLVLVQNQIKNIFDLKLDYKNQENCKDQKEQKQQKQQKQQKDQKQQQKQQLQGQILKIIYQEVIKRIQNYQLYQQDKQKIQQKKEGDQSQKNKNLKNNIQENEEINKPINNFYYPPTNLKDIFKQRGICNQCKKLSHEIHICFLCKWKGCYECKQQTIASHANTKHCRNAIFISSNLGQVKYVSKSIEFQRYSIYQDKYGYELTEYYKDTKFQKYNLNPNKLKQIYKNILNHQIQTIINYEQYKNRRKSF